LTCSFFSKWQYITILLCFDFQKNPKKIDVTEPNSMMKDEGF